MKRALHGELDLIQIQLSGFCIEIAQDTIDGENVSLVAELIPEGIGGICLMYKVLTPHSTSVRFSLPEAIQEYNHAIREEV